MSDAKGNMESQMYRNAAWQFCSLLAPTVFVLLLMLEPGKLLAQQTPPSDQGWSQNNQYDQGYAPNQQSQQQLDYGQRTGTQQPYPDSGQAYPQQGYGQAPGPAQPLNAVQLEQLVAPIALYPDTLVAQVLAASTYPGQVADADHWRQMLGYASPEQIAAGADVQSWDPSVKALSAFPQVLAQMDRNLQWTTDLGNAYYNQPQDVLEAIQVMRRRAQAAGTLQSTPQEAVNYDQGYIRLMPVNPQVVYVPTYNPWTVYGEQVSPYPGFSLLGAVQSFLGSSPITYGLGIAMTAFSHTPWGWLAWGLNWLAQSVLFHQSNYYSHSTTVADWGFRHDGLRDFAGRGGYATRGYGRIGGGYNGNHGEGFGRAADRYAENRQSSSGRGPQAYRGSYGGAPRQAYNYRQAPESRQQLDHRGYGAVESHRSSAGSAYSRSMGTYRTSASGFRRSEFEGRSSRAFASKNFFRSAGKPPHSGGFHRFGGEHAPKSFHGSGKSFGGGHSHGGGGHFSGHGGGKHHR
jgi:uncharacterized protein DUF3300